MISVYELRAERGKLCEWCRKRQGTQRHHALFRRNIRKPELDDRKNLILVCAMCHMSREVDSKIAKHKFWIMLCNRYGRDKMMEWLESLPLKIKHFEFIAGYENEGVEYV